MSQHAHPREIIAVGAAIVGASIALHLAQRGAVVTVIDAGEPGQGASTVSFAWINARGKNPRASTSRNRTGWNARRQRRLRPGSPEFYLREFARIPATGISSQSARIAAGTEWRKQLCDASKARTS